MFTKIAATTLAVAVLATSAMTVSVQTADAANGRHGAFAAGAVIGLATGAIVASQAQRRYAPPPPAYYPAPVYYAHPEPWSPAWYRYCSSKYRSFNPNTGYFTTYSGYQKFCR